MARMGEITGATNDIFTMLNNADIKFEDARDSKGKAKTLDAKLAKATKWFALAFVILTLVLNLVG